MHLPVREVLEVDGRDVSTSRPFRQRLTRRRAVDRPVAQMVVALNFLDGACLHWRVSAFSSTRIRTESIRSEGASRIPRSRGSLDGLLSSYGGDSIAPALLSVASPFGLLQTASCRLQITSRSLQTLRTFDLLHSSHM